MGVLLSIFASARHPSPSSLSSSSTTTTIPVPLSEKMSATHQLRPSTLRATWRQLSLPATARSALQRSSNNVAMISSTAFYLFGGELKPRVPISSDVLCVNFDRNFEREAEVTTYPPPTGSDEEGPVARVGANLVRHPDPIKTVLLLWGGRGGKDMAPLPYSPKEDVWVFDRDTASWSTLVTTGDRPPMRSYAAMVAVHEGRGKDKLYVHAGCPAQGRLASLHVLDLSSRVWSKLADAPGPARGGTAITTIAAPSASPSPTSAVEDNDDEKASAATTGGRKLLARWGGFCGHEVGGPLDIFDPERGTWSSHDAPIEGKGKEEPAKRSVHGFVELYNGSLTVQAEGGGGGGVKQALALLFLGEGEGAPKELGHDGAGKFLADVYVLLRSLRGEYSFQLLSTGGTAPPPQARGWFGYDAVNLSTSGKGTRVVVQGGLNEANERLGDAWALDVVVE